MVTTTAGEVRAMLAAAVALACAAATPLARASDGTGEGTAAPASQGSVATEQSGGSAGSAAANGVPAAAAPVGSAIRIRPGESIIIVARDVSPEWAASLEKVRERDPAGFERATGVLAKRLKALAVLKDRKPQLYALRVEELRIQGEVTALADQWRSAISTGRTEDAAGIEKDLRAKVGTMVDLNLRSRAMELAELDEVMRSMRGDLERDARARDTTVMEALEAYRRGEEPAIGRSPVAVPAPAGAPDVPAPAAPAAPAASRSPNVPAEPTAPAAPARAPTQATP